MDRSELSPAAFVTPASPDREGIEAWAERALSRALDHLTTANSRSPLPDPDEPSTLEEKRAVPDRPISEDTLLDEAETLLRGAMNPGHPGFMGHMDPMPTTASVLGDLLAASANNNMLSQDMSPTFTRLEQQITRALARRFGLGDASGGVMTSGGSLANLHALAVARNVAFEDALRQGVGGHSPVLFASEAAHTSIQKAAMLLGLGTEAVVPVAPDDHRRMAPDALRGALDTAQADDRTPFCVVATAGTTTTGNIDPLPEIADVAEAHDLWLHVDAAYGGALIFSDTHRARLQGIERADSITFNPQKWAYVAKTAAMALFRDMEEMKDVFRIEAPYMREQTAVPNLGEIGVQGTRHADVLKLWMTLRHLGREGLEQLIDESYHLTEYFLARVEERSDLQVAATPEMNLVCFRGEPEGLDGEACDQWNDDLQQSLLRDADVFLSLPRLDGRNWLRAVLLNPFTETAHIDVLFEHVDALLETSA
jgi:glutamate/tyrosine decarboxylase-like PLP-dependent enzyme